MNFFQAMRISASGLSAERLRLDLTASNIANAESTRSLAGGPYRRQVAILAPAENSFRRVLSRVRSKKPGGGVRVVAIQEDPTPFKKVYDPRHPDADPAGYVNYPNVDVMKEMVEAITASRGYEANVTVLNSTKNMFLKTLEIGKG